MVMSVALSVCMIVVTVVTILQNGVILLGTVCNYHQVRKSVPQRAIILSTTIADLGLGAVVMPFALYVEFSTSWNLEHLICDLWISCDILFSTASIVSIAFHSIDKYYSLWSPHHYQGRSRYKFTLLYVAVTWLASGLVAFSAGASGWASTHDNKLEKPVFTMENDVIDLENIELHIKEHEKAYNMEKISFQECIINTNPMFATYSAIISFYVPASAIIFYSYHIRRLVFMTLEDCQWLRRHYKDRRKRRQSQALEFLVVDDSTRQKKQALERIISERAHICRSRRSQLRGREKQIAFLWQLTIITFLVCWTPFFVAHPLNCYGLEFPKTVMMLLPWLGYSHSIVNPILHAFLEPDYLRSFLTLFSNLINRMKNPRRFSSSSSDSSSPYKQSEESSPRKSTLDSSSPYKSSQQSTPYRSSPSFFSPSD